MVPFFIVGGIKNLPQGEQGGGRGKNYSIISNSIAPLLPFCPPLKTVADGYND